MCCLLFPLDSKQAGTFSLAKLALCSLVILLGVAVVYWCKGRRTQELPQYGKKDVDRASSTHVLSVSDYGYRVGVMKRK